MAIWNLESLRLSSAMSKAHITAYMIFGLTLCCIFHWQSELAVQVGCDLNDHLSVPMSVAADAEGSAHDVNKLKTKVRRLYDIANILSSLQLLEKTQLPDSRKPAFRWLGIEERIAAAPTATLKDFYRYCSPQGALVVTQSYACNVRKMG